MIQDRIRRLGGVLLVVGMLAAGTVAPAAAAASPARPDVVLVNQPARRACVGQMFTVGVWFQRSGGSRAYRINVYDPRGVRVFHRRGRAPSAGWALWKIRAKRIGRYRTVYSAHWKNPGVWTAYRAVTRAHRC